jgi:hypothetical protein
LTRDARRSARAGRLITAWEVRGNFGDDGPSSRCSTGQWHRFDSRIDQCGFTVNSVIRGTNTFKVSFDESGNASFQSEAHVVSTLTNVANGKVVHVDSAGRDAFGDIGVVNPDGTITFTDTLTGRDLRVYTSHSNVLLRDAGFLAIVDTVDSEGNFISQELITHGPHQFAGDFTAFCDAITAAIG